MIDWLGVVQCNGQRAHSAQYLVGTGTPLSIHMAWSVAYSSAEVRVKYFASTATQAKEGMPDFIGTNHGTTLNLSLAIPDIVSMPATAVAVAPGKSTVSCAVCAVWHKQDLRCPLQATTFPSC